jgi:hypothetical protein
VSIWDSVERSQPPEVLVHEIEDQKDRWEEKHLSQGRHDSGVGGVEDLQKSTVGGIWADEMKRRARLAAQARGVLKNKTDNEMLDIRHRGVGSTYEDKFSKFLVQKSPWSNRCSTTATTTDESRFPTLPSSSSKFVWIPGQAREARVDLESGRRLSSLNWLVRAQSSCCPSIWADLAADSSHLARKAYEIVRGTSWCIQMALWKV